MSSSLLTLSVQPPNNNNNVNINSTLSPVPTSTSTSPCITPLPQLSQQQQQMPVICAAKKKVQRPSIPIGRKRPAINLAPLNLESVIEHRRRENDARLKDTKAHIEASFLSETPSSPGGYSSTSTDSQPSGSDDDSQNSISALCSSAKYEKRIRFDSTTPSIYSNNNSQSISVDSLDSEFLGGASSAKTSGIYDIPNILGADEYFVVPGGDEFQVLEKSTQKLFQAIKMNAQKYKQFMKVAARIESARKLFHPQEFRRLKSLVMPNDTRIVHGSNGLAYLLMPNHHTSLNLKVKDAKTSGKLLSEKEVQSFVFQIVEMMELCHQVGLFFGDFKYEKFVFVDAQKTQIRPRSPLIFHLSNDSNNDTLFGTKVGWAFMAPEMLNRRQTSYSGAAADMWALGVLAFTLLAGNYPFIGNEPQALFTRIRSRSITAKSEKEFVASPEARIMVYSLLCKNPSDRPSAERLKQCHWLKMSPKEFTVISYGNNSLSTDCGRSHSNNNFNSNQQIPLTQFLQQQIQHAHQQFLHARNGGGGLPRVHSAGRLNRAMEHRLAISRATSSDQVVPVTAHVLFPTTNNVSQRICVFAADARR